MADLALVKEFCDALNDKKAVKTTAIDITGISVMADVFIITSGTNASQIDAMTAAVNEVVYKHPELETKSEGNSASGWVLMDLGDIIIHIFTREAREFYNLEKIWKDGKIITY